MVQILILLLGASFIDAAKVNSCGRIFSTPYGRIHSQFPHHTTYDVEIARIPIKNQCATGHCHMYTWLSDLGSKRGIPLSNAFLDIMDIYDRALVALKDKKVKITEGNFSSGSRSDIGRMGLVPLESWKGQSDIISEERYRKLFAGLEAILINALEQAKDEKSPSVVRAIHREARSDIYDFINNMAGPIPQKFAYQGKNYSPLSFAKKYFPELYLPMIEVNIAHDSAAIEIRRNDSMQITSVKMNWDNAENLMTALIDSGRPMYLAYTHAPQFVDSRTGIMSIAAYSYPTNARVLSRDVRGTYNLWSGSHAVLIVGYQKDSVTGKVVKWKIQNSWSEKAGDQGYYHMYRDFLHFFGFGFTFVLDGKVDVAKALESPE